MPEPPPPTATSSARRPVHTCLRCRRLKLKCDHARPCRGCVRSGTLDECQYESPEDRGSPSEAPSGISGTTGPVAGRAHSPGPERKRRRAVRVCSRCRRLKLRCDQDKPCSSCVTAGAVEDGECVYLRWPGEEPNTAPTTSSLHEVHELQQRIKALESELAAAAPASGSNNTHPYVSPASMPSASASTSPSLAPRDLRDLRVPPTADIDIPTLLVLMPPPDECRRLIRSFQGFDLLFRLVHMPTFLRRAERIIAGLASSACSSSRASCADSAAAAANEFDIEHLPGIALFVAAMLCGATIFPPPVTEFADTSPHDPRSSEGHLRLLLDTALAMCDLNYTSLPKVDYVHVHLMSVFTCMAGRGGGPQRGWLASGRAYHAALLVGLNKEERMLDETPFEREMRRRIWWEIVQARLFIADRLRIEVQPMVHNVPRPLNLTDAEFDQMSLGGQDGTPHKVDTLTEWSYINAKFDMVMMFQHRDAYMARTDLPLMDRLKGAAAIIEDYATSLPLHQQGRSDVVTNLPSWAQLQARISDIAIAELYVHHYRPYFSSSEVAANGVAVGAYALDQGVRATHRLVQAVKVFTEQVLFGWLDLDTPVFALWTCGMRSFTAGLVLAYSLIADPDNPAARARMADFEAVVGILRSRRTLPGRTKSNESALATLEQLREIIKSKDRSFHHLLDPYTGKPVDMPFVLPDFASGEWVEWDTLFQELFQEGGGGGGGNL